MKQAVKRILSVFLACLLPVRPQAVRMSWGDNKLQSVNDLNGGKYLGEHTYSALFKVLYSMSAGKY